MPKRHFIPATMLEISALYQIPHGRTFVIECRACGVMKEIDPASLDRVSSRISLKELSSRFCCTLYGEKNARIMAGGWNGLQRSNEQHD